MNVALSPRAGAVLYALDPRRVGAFYAGVAAFAITREASDHIVPEAPGFHLVIVKIPDAIAATIAIAVPPDRPRRMSFASSGA